MQKLSSALGAAALAALLVSLPLVAWAQGGSGGGAGTVNLTDPLGGRGFNDIAEGIADWLVTIGVPIMGIMVVYAGYQFMTAGGDPSKVKSGRETLFWAVVGFGVILLAESIIAVVQEILQA